MPKPIFKDTTESMIRVNHAGEYGAMRIYQGQLDATKDPKTKELITHMMEQELAHLRYFEEEMKLRKVRPTILLPVWHYASYALGFATSLLGKQAAMLCTQAVEEVIDNHYTEQIQALRCNKDESSLLTKIEEYRLEELEHKEIAIDHGSKNTPLYALLHGAIGLICKVAINISKKA